MPKIVVKKRIENKLAKLKVENSSGLNQIHQKVKYETRHVISYPLYAIYNKKFIKESTAI